VYRSLFESKLEKEIIDEFRESTNKNRVRGDNSHKKEVEQLNGGGTALKARREW
jgi:hypothetical protein